MMIWFCPQDSEFQLKDEKFSVLKGSGGKGGTGRLQKMGIYLVVTIKPGLVIVWDRKTSLFIKLNPQLQVNNNHASIS